ncbi:DAK2 domain-containing protein [Xylophilus rhododendri]|uniref:DAK2 domain-containing protein n=1 Tax=Xylophilus rhododendri TaxID=2697032 RepID=A0A857J8Y7_9BURK|nr:DAK2 domain-containing protein [Xylophilus rhododendri]QHJ00445.1 DAK2 domain-containing protein [Xylophilus rhododendri]
MTTETLHPLDLPAVHAGLQRCAQAMEAAAPELNALDARLGDGDLGTTLSRCAQHLAPVLAAPSATLASLFKACAQACAKASGSSFGTLLAVAFLEAAKATAGTPALDREALVALLDRIGQALSQRGGAKPGDKTMLDSIDAIARALQSAADTSPAALAATARQATDAALHTLRDQPNRIGRARMFAERSVGLDDPGMVAVQRLVQAL